MKKRISFLLCALMLLSSLTLFANAETSVSYEAPVLYGTQSTTPVENKFSVRFLSVTTSLNGAKVGYSIEASYGEGTEAKVICFTGEEMETSVIFSSILADSKTVTVNELASKLELSRFAGIFALELTDVPANEDITFSVKTYVKNAAGEVCAESESASVRYTDGAIYGSNTEQLIYSKDFNEMTLNCLGTSTEDTDTVKAAVEAATGWTANACGTSKPEYPAGMVSENGVLKIYGGSGVNNYTVLPKGTLSKYNAYSIEMDLNVEKMNNKMIIFALHPKYNSPTDTVGRSNEIRFRDYKTEARSTTGGTNGYLGMEYNLGTANASIATKSDLGLTGSGLGQDFHMKISVNTTTKALSVTVTPKDGTPVQVFSTTMTVDPDGGFMIAAQQAVFTIDNLVIKGIAKAE